MNCISYFFPLPELPSIVSTMSDFGETMSIMNEWRGIQDRVLKANCILCKRKAIVLFVAIIGLSLLVDAYKLRNLLATKQIKVRLWSASVLLVVATVLLYKFYKKKEALGKNCNKSLHLLMGHPWYDSHIAQSTKMDINRVIAKLPPLSPDNAHELSLEQVFPAARA